MKLSEELQWRGFWNQTTFTDDKLIDSENFTLYLGTDPSADSLHVGHLAVYMMVRHFLERGHKVFLLVGGGTGMIGDMRDTEERNLLPYEEIEHNKQALKSQVSRIFAGRDFTLVDNADWLAELELLPFLRDIGKNFNMADLVSREFFKARINNGKGLSFAEFTYTLLQGYDFWHLFNQYGVNLQIGGSDQWGNLLSGVDLIRKKENAEVYAMTAPLLINKSTGRKFGKSEGGAVWLDENKTSVYKFYQFWLNVDDESAIEYMKIFTMLDRDTIEAIAENHAVNPGARSAQKVLAREVTDIVHGSVRRESVERVNEVLFGGGDFKKLSDDDLGALAEEIPCVDAGIDVIEALVESGAVGSNGEAKRLLKSGAISLNGEKLAENKVVNDTSLLKKGKNTFVLIMEGDE
ncbi:MULTISPECIES: tyrosine--tRNA ligase [unclassified Candidatus Nanosynbacter]|uniref:tyrosine--tRNA ligase n=1 Tax=unclassified Candidatus Nanosynbacter TaxID=2725944 RepID=UPI001FB7DDBB|nr:MULTISPECIES: tyrosine--tRNA ligase [unclassified Candidatus Nanosynbacter]MCJ1963360.1 tyrosine--tRNA ligase [Candidatus Nanosynbacter sp. TM7-033]UOG67848.1 tyrosine--tRNA ligase [Candidatus Nanosynbacter sp. HMT-352]